jgi:hypothetical protein
MGNHWCLLYRTPPTVILLLKDALIVHCWFFLPKSFYYCAHIPVWAPTALHCFNHAQLDGANFLLVSNPAFLHIELPLLLACGFVAVHSIISRCNATHKARNTNSFSPSGMLLL